MRGPETKSRLRILNDAEEPFAWKTNRPITQGSVIGIDYMEMRWGDVGGKKKMKGVKIIKRLSSNSEQIIRVAVRHWTKAEISFN